MTTNIELQERVMASKMAVLDKMESKEDKTERDLQQIANLYEDVAKLNDKIERERTRVAKEQARSQEDEKLEALEAWVNEIIEANDIHYSSDPHRYMEKHDGRWMTLSVQALREYYSPLQKNDVKELFDRAMEAKGRKFKKMTYSFEKKPAYVLNLMSMDAWLTPDDEGGPPHPLFDLILWSCGGGTDEGYDHLRQCLLWKYLHPADFKIPVPVLYGEGGCGKNFLFEKVFETLWPGQSVQLSTEQTLGNFNGMMVGRTAIMINEAAGDKVDYEAIKMIAHAATLTINEKYGGQYQSDNTPWLWMGCNDPAGAVKLSGGGVDRRWSPIEIKKTLAYWAGHEFGHDAEWGEQWLKENEHVASNPAEVRKWLWSLMLQGIPEFRPSPLRGASYDDMAKTQMSPQEEILEIVTSRPDVQWIAGDLLYDSYIQLSKRANPRGGVLGRNKFYKHVEVLLAQRSGLAGWLLEDARVDKDGKDTRVKVLRRLTHDGRMKLRDMKAFVDHVGQSRFVEASYLFNDY